MTQHDVQELLKEIEELEAMVNTAKRECSNERKKIGV